MTTGIRFTERRVPFAVFVSGEGTNLQALLEAEGHDDRARYVEEFPGYVAIVVSDKPGCRALLRAAEAGIPVFAQDPKSYASKADFEDAVLWTLLAHGVKWIALAGYMRIIGKTLLDAYPKRIVNIHPSLLPNFPGRHAVRDALCAGVFETGVTVHFVDDGIDTGSVIAQQSVTIDDGMTEGELLGRIHRVEHTLYPRVLRQLLSVTQTESTNDGVQ